MQTQSKYIRFLNKISFLLVLFVLLDFGIGNVLRHFYFRQIAGLNYRTTYAIDSTRAEILVFGSSRANHHYVPEIFEEGLNLSFYNTGRDGNFLLYNYAVLKVIVARYTPEIVIFDLNPDELFYKGEDYERLSILLPYYRNHPELRTIVQLRRPFDKFKLLSSIYPFNSSLLTIGIGNMAINKQRKEDFNGYIPLKGILMDSSINEYVIDSSQIDQNKINALTEIIKICNEKKIKLLFVQSPIYAHVNPRIFSSVRNYCSNTTLMLEYSNDLFFLQNHRFFQDNQHLNNWGAREFSMRIVQYLKKVS